MLKPNCGKIIVNVMNNFYIKSFIATCSFFIGSDFYTVLLLGPLDPLGPFGLGVGPGMLNDGGGTMMINSVSYVVNSIRIK